MSGNIKRRDTHSDSWTAVDGLGRKLPEFSESGPVREDRYAAIFYFLWHPSIFGLGDPGKPRNVHEILTDNKNALNDPNLPEWDAPGTFYWGEPMFGYYNLDVDKYAIRKHAQMLTDIGIDFLVFDFTNFRENEFFYTWKTLNSLCETFEEIKNDGGATPQIACMMTWDGPYCANGANRIYNDFYKKDLYSDLWFIWDGKPLILADINSMDNDEVRGFFTFRRAHPHYTPPTEKNAWSWNSIYPQSPSYTDDCLCEEVAVSVSQNWANGPSYTFMSAMDDEGRFIARGRSYNNGKEPLYKDPVSPEYPSKLGLNLKEQLDYALELDPKILFITGWNEWIAGRFMSDPFNTGDRLPAGGGFCDAFTAEFSRDIEPTFTAELGDHYYMQLAAAIRKYKGIRKPQKAGPPKIIDITGSFDQWDSVTTEYLDDIGDTQNRDCSDIFGRPILNDTGRNDFALMKVSHDCQKLYFYVKTVEDITDCEEPHRMQLFIKTKCDAPGWEGYQFVINRSKAEVNLNLERSTGGWNWETLNSRIEYRLEKNEMQLAVPLKNLGLDADSIDIEFKWNDNMQNTGDIYDFYLYGDTAPNGRFNYRYFVE